MRSVSLRGFMRHDETKVELPQRGVVLVSGPNGGGKSSIAEAVAWAGWGRTMRGTAPWREGRDCEVVLDAEPASVVRARRGGKGLLRFSDDHGPAPEYETVTKAQDALEAAIGTFDVWRRTHVFSSQDAAHFTLASDGERKRLLEPLLGIDKFDEALARCRGDERQAEDALARVEHDAAILRERFDGALRQLDEARRATPSGSQEAADLLEGEKTEVRQALARLQPDVERCEHVLAESLRRRVDGDARLEMLRRQLERIDRDQCAACEQPIPPEVRARLRAQHTEEAEAVRELKAATLRADAPIIQEKFRLVELECKLHERWEHVCARLAAARSEALAARRSTERAAQLEGEAAAVEEELAAAESTRQQYSSRRDELDATERVLGLRGVRAQVLGRALAGIEGAANAWLARIAGPDLRLELHPYVERKSGAVSDAIRVEVLGAGGGLGYRASSGGERRRIDVALLMALSEVAAASGARPAGTAFFDEVLDGLDDAGAEATCRALRDLAADRAVVVISHRAGIASMLEPVLRLRVEDGRLV